MFIETKRLELVALKPIQLRKWIADIHTLEKEIDCYYCAEPMSGVFLDIVKGQLDIIEKDPINYLYYTFWFIIKKKDRKVIGSIDFKNVPNEAGEVEIGYGLGSNFQHNGYMTEAVQSFCNWGLKQEKINHIIAETEIENSKSQYVLKRCNFIKYRQEATMWWRL